MSYLNQASFGLLRSITPGSIGASYALFSTLSGYTIAVTFKNETDGDVLVSIDGTNDHLVFPPNSYGTYDVSTNSPKSNNLMLREGMAFYVKDGTTASTTGTFYMESLILQGVQ